MIIFNQIKRAGITKSFLLFLFLRLTLFLVLITPYNSFSQTLHGFIFCKTNEKDIPLDYQGTFDKGMQKNFELIDSLCINIAKNLNIEYAPHFVLGKSFNLKQIELTLDASKNNISKEDVVVLYFSTHGYVTQDSRSVFPIIDIRNGDFISTYLIHTKISKAKPKFLLTLIDACSNYANLTPQDSFLFRKSFEFESTKYHKSNDVSKLKNTSYLSLFKGCTQIISCAGQPGATTYATSEGSIFTSSFLKVFYNTVNQGNGLFSWSKILDDTKERVLQNTSLPGLTKYYPQWEFGTCDTILANKEDAFSPSKDTIENTTSSVGTGVALESWINKIESNKYIYQVQISAQSHDEKIDSVIYYLKYDLPNSKLILRSSDSVNSLYPDETILPVEEYKQKVQRGQNFNYRFFSSESFTIKTEIFLKSGKVIDIYNRLNIDSFVPFYKRKIWQMVFFFSFLIVILVFVYRKIR